MNEADMEKGVAKDAGFEAMKGRAERIYNLMYARSLADMAIGRDRYILPGRDAPETGVQVRENWGALKDVPEFRDFVLEEENIFGAGVSEQEIKKYSGLYKKAYEKIAEIESQITDLQKSDYDAYSMALSARVENWGKPWSEVKEGVLKIAYEERVENKKSLEISSKYNELASHLRGAVKGMKAKGLLEVQDEKAKKSGFSSKEEMWNASVENMRKFRVRVGDERFKELIRGVSGVSDWDLKDLVEGTEK